MATESYGRTDDGIAWEVRHELWSGPWRWTMWLPDGRRVESPERYETERQALNAVEDARRQVLAGLPPVETMASLRAPITVPSWPRSPATATAPRRCRPFGISIGWKWNIPIARWGGCSTI